MADNSRDWGKERSEYTLRLNEAEHGLGRTQGVMFHDFETYVSNQSASKAKNDQALNIMSRIVRKPVFGEV